MSLNETRVVCCFQSSFWELVVLLWLEIWGLLHSNKHEKDFQRDPVSSNVDSVCVFILSSEIVTLAVSKRVILYSPDNCCSFATQINIIMCIFIHISPVISKYWPCVKSL